MSFYQVQKISNLKKEFPLGCTCRKRQCIISKYKRSVMKEMLHIEYAYAICMIIAIKEFYPIVLFYTASKSSISYIISSLILYIMQSLGININSNIRMVTKQSIYSNKCDVILFTKISFPFSHETFLRCVKCCSRTKLIC